MSDLISREVVLEYLRHQHNSIAESPGVPSSLKVLALKITDDCMNYIDKLESSYDVDKVFEQLESIRKDENIRFADQVVSRAVNIVKGAVKDE